MEKFQTPIKLKEDEEFVLKVHHYFLVFVPHLLLSLLIFVLDFFLLYFLFRQGAWGVYVFLLVLLITLFYFFRILFFWYKNIFVITDKRLVDFDQQGFFNKKVSEIPFNKIRDVSFHRKGLWQTMCKYGDLHIHMKESDKPIKLYNIKDTEDLQELMNKLINKKSVEKTENVIEKETEPEEKDDSEMLKLYDKIEKLDESEKAQIYKELKRDMSKKGKIIPKEVKKEQKDKFLEDLWKEDSL